MAETQAKLTVTDPFQSLAVRAAGMFGLPPLLARRLYRYGVTGVTVTLLYVAIAWAAVWRLGASVTLGAVIAFLIAGSISYVVNTLWGFAGRMSGRTVRRFVLVTTTSFCLNAVLAWSLERLGVAHLALSVATVVVVATFNFVSHNLYTYRAEG